ncbi:zinc ABC transporter substrate-binding protein [Halofilum ochraceum]|uniref:zinc ABC transporter substrate-binding protein n=1 Tax=Halofilum ochraceum TaxID=1611323 RepID=UPI000829D047|nr:zinc ABC transporter substrate-binding protein [Halofilum ochraceum]
MPRSLPAALFALALLGAASAAAAGPRVVVSIAPLHSLVAAVAGERTEPHLIVPAGQSPHTFSLAPSDARALARADIVFSAGGATDRFLERPLDSLAGDAVKVRLLDMDGVRTLGARSGGVWRNPHGGEDGGEQDTAHTGDGDEGHGHKHGDDPTHGDPSAETVDPHAWLDPRNAIAFVRAAAQRLGRIDPEHAGVYRANADATIERIKAIDMALKKQLEPVAERPYLVFHDAYQYFESRYDLTPAGSIVVDPGRPPGARRLSELRERIGALGATCLFVEPQFEPQIARTIAEGTGARIAELDPLGAGLTPGPDLYPDLLRKLGESLRACLAGSVRSDGGSG